MRPYRFKKSERLRSQKIIDALFTRGKRLSHYPLQLRYLREDHLSTDQIVFLIPKRISKRAVDRNLLRRRLREIYRTDGPTCRGDRKVKYALALLYRGEGVATYTLLQKALSALLRKL